MGRVFCERNAAGSTGCPGERLEQGGDRARPDLGGRTSPEIRSRAFTGRNEHDTFPPTTILLNLCMLDWGFTEEVKARLGYYLSHFVKQDGTFDYYGPAISEYGQMLTLAARYVRVTGDTGWMQENLPALQRIAESLLAQMDASRKRYPPDSPYYGLLWGSAEADTREDKRFYFSGDVWCWRGLEEMGQLLNDVGQQSGMPLSGSLGRAARRGQDIPGERPGGFAPGTAERTRLRLSCRRSRGWKSPLAA